MTEKIEETGTGTKNRTSNILSELRREVKKLLGLLKEPQPGNGAWHQTLNRSMETARELLSHVLAVTTKKCQITLSFTPEGYKELMSSVQKSGMETVDSFYGIAKMNYDFCLQKKSEGCELWVEKDGERHQVDFTRHR